MKRIDRIKFKKLGFTDKQLDNYRKINYSKLNFKQRKAIYEYIRGQNLKIIISIFVGGFLFSLFIFVYELFNGVLEGNNNTIFILLIFMGILISGFVCTNYLMKIDKPNSSKINNISTGDLLKDKSPINVEQINSLSSEEVVSKITKYDENFSLSEFEIYVKNIFLLIFKAFFTKNYRVLRRFESNRLFYQHRLYITKLIDHKEIEKRKDFRIKGVILKNFEIVDNRQVLTVALTSKVGKQLSDRYNTCDGAVSYILIFSRKKEFITKEKTADSSLVEEFNLYNSGKKVYDNLSLLLKDNGWILTDIRLINMR